MGIGEAINCFTVKIFFSKSSLFTPYQLDPVYEAQLVALRKEVFQKAILRKRMRKEKVNSIKTQLYCNIAHTSEKYLGKTPNIWAGMLMLSQNLFWGGKMNTFEKEKQKEEAIWQSIEGKYPAKVIKDTRLYMDILDYYWYKAACVPTLDETKEVLMLLSDKEFKFKLERVMDAHGYIIREFGPEIDRRVVRLALKPSNLGYAPNTETERSAMWYEKALRIRVPFADLTVPIRKGEKPQYSVPDYCVEDSNRTIQRRKEGYEYMKKYVLKMYGGEP